MRYLRKFNESLKQEIIDNLNSQEGDYDSEELENVYEILDEYDDDLSGLDKTDSKLIIRLLDDEELISKLDVNDDIEDPFAFEEYIPKDFIFNSEEDKKEDSLDLYEIMSEWIDKNDVHHSCHNDLDNFVSYVQSNYDYHIKKSSNK